MSYTLFSYLAAVEVTGEPETEVAVRVGAEVRATGRLNADGRAVLHVKTNQAELLRSRVEVAYVDGDVSGEWAAADVTITR